MKLFHLSDLHIGKRVYEFSMMDDQAYIFNKILAHAEQQKPDAILISGDIYDKPIPQAEAVLLFDSFLNALAKKNIAVYIISGNHDSAERIAFGSSLMNKSGIHLSPVYHGKIEPIRQEDSYGAVYFYMLPFIKPASVRRFFPDEEIETYTDAVRVAVKNMKVDSNQRNIFLAHQFVTGAVRCDSEAVSIGGLDNVDASVFQDFDYVALGHIHTPQQFLDGKVRYCGAPLKYSFSEEKSEKAVVMVDMKEKGNLNFTLLPMQPQRDMKSIKGAYDQLTLKSYYENTTLQNDYLHITLTDEDDVANAAAKLGVVYPYLMKLSYDNKRTRTSAEICGVDEQSNQSPLELFEDFYEKQNNSKMSEEQQAFAHQLIEKIWEAQP